jgi:peptidoglycan/xylan/chitin deacetylase (PgdA/CDA1 family)
MPAAPPVYCRFYSKMPAQLQKRDKILIFTCISFAYPTKLMAQLFFRFFLFFLTGLSACQIKNESHRAEARIIPAEKPLAVKPAGLPPDTVATAAPPPATAAEILMRKQVPVLCYHQIRDWRPGDSRRSRDYIVPLALFRAQLKMLADSGYHTILPDQLLAYLHTGAPLPPKPILLTFDDTALDQYTVAAPEMKKYGFKGVFFVMTVSLGRPRYMSKAQVRELSEAGHIIGSHTWDHQNVRKYGPRDWLTQVEKPTRQLEVITGKPVRYFAYPFGLWRSEAFAELKARGFAAAFQLSTKRDPAEPLFTIRRLIASGYWSPRTLHNNVVRSF